MNGPPVAESLSPHRHGAGVGCVSGPPRLHSLLASPPLVSGTVFYSMAGSPVVLVKMHRRGVLTCRICVDKKQEENIYSEVKQVFGQQLKLINDRFWEVKQCIMVTIYS